MILGWFRRRPRLVTWPLLTSWPFEAHHGLKEDMPCELIPMIPKVPTSPTLPTSPTSLWHVNDMPPESFVRSVKAHDLMYRALCFGTLCLLVSLLRVLVSGCTPYENKDLISSPRSWSSITVTSLYRVALYFISDQWYYRTTLYRICSANDKKKPYKFNLQISVSVNFAYFSLLVKHIKHSSSYLMMRFLVYIILQF